MDESKKKAVGSLNISEDVIVTVAKLATLDVDGVAELYGEVNKLSKLKKNRPISVTMLEDVAAIDIKIKVKNGAKAVAVAQDVQTAVKESVQSMTGVTVAIVNVSVNGVVF